LIIPVIEGVMWLKAVTIKSSSTN